MAAATPSSTAKTGSPSPLIVVILLVLAIVVGMLLLYGLWQFWPSAAVLSLTGPSEVNFLGIHRLVNPDVRLFIVVAIAGALGGLMHSTRSFAWYVGHSGLKWRWLPYYVSTLVVGAGLATIVYVVLRGGLFSGKTATTDVNPYGFVAVGAIVGLFTEQALVMLRRVATDFFAQAPQGHDGEGGDSLDADAPVVETGNAAEVTATSATLWGRLTPSSEPTTYYFEYGTSTDYGSKTADADAPDADQTDVSAPVGDLQPGTEYHFRLVAGSGDNTAQGTDGAFTTGVA